MASFSDLVVFIGDISVAEINHYTKNPMRAQESTHSYNAR